MSRILEEKWGDRLVFVEKIGGSGAYHVNVQAEAKGKAVTQIVFTSQDSDATMAAYSAVAKTLVLLHGVGDQADQPTPRTEPGHADHNLAGHVEKCPDCGVAMEYNNVEQCFYCKVCIAYWTLDQLKERKEQ